MLKQNIESSVLSDDVAANGTTISSPKDYEIPSIVQPNDEANNIAAVTPEQNRFRLVQVVANKVRETVRWLTLVKPSLPANPVPIEETGNTEPDSLITSPALLKILKFFGKKGNANLPNEPEAPVAPDIQAPNCLPDPNAEDYQDALHNLVTYHLGQWSIDNNPYSPEETARLDGINQICSKVLHLSLPKEDAYALTTLNCDTIIAVIRRLKNKVGKAELAVMVLIAKIVETELYINIGCRSGSEFFRRNAELMGISISRAWDYYRRGKAFFLYGKYILNGTGEFTGIPLEEFIASHMSALTLLDRAVEKLGVEKALINLKTLTFREFQKTLSDKKPLDEKASNKSRKKDSFNDASSQEPLSPHEEQKRVIASLGLKPNEKRLLQIIAKGGKYYSTRGLTEEQFAAVETRLRQYRHGVYERNLQGPLSYKRSPFDPDKPLEYSDDLIKLDNVNDIILRIRAGLARVVPTRRAIAVLVYRLYYEALYAGKPVWKFPYKEVKYSSFKDFAMDVLGLGEDYRDYVAVGKVLKTHYNFLEGLSDMDTEDVFLKLRYLSDALKTHKGDEPLVLARLRSLTIREFKCFSVEPDFEITFSKKLTEKQLEKFSQALFVTRDPFGAFSRHHSIEFIETYYQGEDGSIEKIVSEVCADQIRKEIEAANSAISEDKKPESTDSTDDGVDNPLLTSSVA
jgi:hypothetical protein